MSGLSLYQRILGDSFGQLCPAVRKLHAITTDFCAAGHCTIERGNGWLVNLLAWMAGMPQAGRNVALAFSISVQHGREVWTRDFAGHRFHSVLWTDNGTTLLEHLGPVRLEFRLDVQGGGLRMLLQRGLLFGVLRLPFFCLPKVTTIESCELGYYRFEVQVDWPLLGPVIRYCGVLDVEGAQ
jgi:hypothetical protein